MIYYAIALYHFISPPHIHSISFQCTDITAYEDVPFVVEEDPNDCCTYAVVRCLVARPGEFDDDAPGGPAYPFVDSFFAPVS